MLSNKTSQSDRPERNGLLYRISILALLIIVTVLIRLPDLAMPLERDEGEYAYAAQLITSGGVPYRDSFCQKPPVVFFWYLAGFGLFGETKEGIHLVMALASALTAFGLYCLCARLASSPSLALSAGPAGRGAGWFGALVFMLAAAGTGYFGSAANTEIFMLAPLVFGVLFLLKGAEDEKPLHWFLAGLFFAAAFLTKQVALFSFLGPGLFAAWLLWRKKSPVWSHVKPLLFGGAGAAVFVLPVLVWFGGAGALGEFTEAAFAHNLDYVGSPFGAWKWKQVFRVLADRFLLSDGVLWACLVVSFLFFLTKKESRRHGALWFCLLWFTGSLFGTALGPYTFGHYFLQLLPPLAAAAALLFGMIPALFVRLPGWGQAVSYLMVVAVLLPMAAARVDSLSMPIEKRSFELYKVYGPPPFAAAAEVGEFVRATTDPGDRILVVGSEPEILFYARRRSATRYTIFYPLTAAVSRSDAMCDELFREIAANPPAKIIRVYCPTSFITGGPSTAKLMSINSRIEAILGKDYVEEDLVFIELDGNVCWKEKDSFTPSGIPPLFHIYRRKGDTVRDHP